MVAPAAVKAYRITVKGLTGGHSGMDIHKGLRVLDLACGQGFFTRAFELEGAEVAGVDISSELIGLAQKQSPKEIKYFVRSALDLGVFTDGYFEKITIVLSIQNIDAPHSVPHHIMGDA